jgi:hypothetical protein
VNIRLFSLEENGQSNNYTSVSSWNYRKENLLTSPQFKQSKQCTSQNALNGGAINGLAVKFQGN